MNIKKGTPGKGGGARPDSFSYTPVATGLKGNWNGWLAGEPYWADEAHEHTDADPGSKPCLGWLTDGAVKCRRCRMGRPVVPLGWVPIYREEDTHPCIVIVHHTVSDLLEGLKYPDYVLVGRVSPKTSVFVKKAAAVVRMKTEKESRLFPVNIVNDLLQIWKLPELNEWLKGRHHEAAAAPEVPPVLRQRLSVPPPTTPVEALAIDAEKKAGDGAAVFGGAVGDVMDRLKKRIEKNGHHKPATGSNT